MIIKKTLDSEFSYRKTISGYSTINHAVRVQLQLSLEEYVLMDFIFQENQKRTTSIRFDDYFKATGFINENIKELFSLMKDRGLLVLDTKYNRPDVFDEWKAIFSSSDLFAQLWKIHAKGNQPTAKERLPKALKMITFELLKEKLKRYVAACNANQTFKKGLDVWLNPQKEHWNDPLPGNSQAPATITQIKFKSIP